MQMNRNRYAAGLLALVLSGGMMLAGCTQSQSSDPTAAQSGLQKQTQNTGTDGEDGNQTDVESMDDAIDLAGDEISPGTTKLSGNAVKITAGGTYTLSGSGKMVIVDAKGQDVTLVLDGVTLKNDTGPGIYVKKAESLSVELKGDNAITCGKSFEYEALNAALYSKADLKISGDGSLDIQTEYGHGIKAKDSAEFDCRLQIEALQDGIHVNDTAVFAGGSYEIQAQSEGIESKDVLEIREGTFSVNAADDALNAASSLKISGGKLDLTSRTNDAVDSNGTLEISGGQIQAVALRSPETAFDVDNTPFVISGGTIAGLGTNGVYPTQADQPLLLAAVSSAGPVRVEKDGKTILEAGFDQASSESDQGRGPGSGSLVLFLSCPEMKAGDTVTVYVNDESLGEVTLEQGTTTLGTVATMGGPGGGGQQGPGGMMEGRPSDPDQMPEGPAGGRSRQQFQ